MGKAMPPRSCQRLTVIDVLPAASHEGEEEDFSVQAAEALPASHHAPSPLRDQLDGLQHVVVLDGRDDLVHAPGGEKQT